MLSVLSLKNRRQIVVPVVSVVFQKPQADCCAHAAACKEVHRLDQPGLKRRPACKAVLSEAVVTGGEALG